MVEFFGKISPALIGALISGLTQWIKQAFPELSERMIQLIVFGMNAFFVIPYHLSVGEITWWRVFEAIFYSLIMSLYSMGFYSLFIKDRG